MSRLTSTARGVSGFKAFFTVSSADFNLVSASCSRPCSSSQRARRAIASMRSRASRTTRSFSSFSSFSPFFSFTSLSSFSSFPSISTSSDRSAAVPAISKFSIASSCNLRASVKLWAECCISASCNCSLTASRESACTRLQQAAWAAVKCVIALGNCPRSRATFPSSLWARSPRASASPNISRHLRTASVSGLRASSQRPSAMQISPSESRKSTCSI
mmetsp:Transcript_126325/g.246329  ORF Transcript_126325/g.246329 Transcript_126325/m.246329 type:complete len:217 (+) Transcript_126325:359-1009(+)